MSDAVTLITLDEASLPSFSPTMEKDRAVAIADIIDYNQFVLGPPHGPYHLHISAGDKRLRLDLTGQGTTTRLALSLTPLRSVIRDYFLICDSYEDAMKHASAARIETIDMARRGLHNEAARLLMEQWEGKVALEEETARRFFTLICVLHAK